MEKPTPLISVIIPVYNVADYLVPCIESVCAQTYTNLEIVVVNDGSTDSSPEILRRFAEKDPRVVVIDKQNGGLVLARRDGVARSTGEFIFWVDGDDHVSLDCVANLYDAIVRNRCDVASAQMVRVSNNYMSTDGSMKSCVMDNRGFIETLLLHRHLNVAGKLYRRGLWAGFSYYGDISLGEDFVLNLKLALSPGAPSIAFADDAFYFYVQRPGSIIRKKDNFAYLENFMGKVAEITSNNRPYGDELNAEITAERTLRFYVYIKKSRNEWKGDTPLYIALREEVVAAGTQLKGLVPGAVITSVKLYRRRRNKILINIIATFRRIKQSLRRRNSAFDISGVRVVPSAKLLVKN